MAFRVGQDILGPRERVWQTQCVELGRTGVWVTPSCVSHPVPGQRGAVFGDRNPEGAGFGEGKFGMSVSSVDKTVGDVWGRGVLERRAHGRRGSSECGRVVWEIRRRCGRRPGGGSSWRAS